MEQTVETVGPQLLLLTRQFLLEQDMEGAVRAVTMTASLERQLGIDSLGKVELFRRIEKTFDTTFTDIVMGQADSLEEIAKAIIAISPGKKLSKKPPIVANIASFEMDLSKINTLQDALTEYATHWPARPHIYLQDEKGQEEVITYGALFDAALCISNSLIAAGIKPDDTVSIMLPTGAAFFQTFFGVLLAGAIPVPIYPPFRADRLEEYAIRETKILNNAEARALITFIEAKRLGPILKSYVPSLKLITTTEKLLTQNNSSPKIYRNTEDPALLQYTSGSTGDPKGILLQHKNILANIRAINEAICIRPTDNVVSWLPLYHDMGLFSWINSLYFGLPITILSPLAFLYRPERWLWAIHYHRGTITAAPNFAYELCIKKINEDDIQGLDLSSLRLLCNGAEAVNPETFTRFYDRFKKYGLKKEALFPVYGLAENTVALSVPPLDRGLRIDRIERIPFEKELRAVPSAKNKNSRKFVSVGKAIPNHEIRIVNDNNELLAERLVGNVQFCGPSAMCGYYHALKATQRVYHNGWWGTGDLGYMAEGELFITGRKKDVIIKAGRNLYPEILEEIVGNISGIRKGCVIAFGVTDPNLGTEKIIIIAESNAQTQADKDKLISTIVEQVNLGVATPPDHVVIVAPNKVPKTSSGKLQRSDCKQLYLRGTLTKKPKTIQLQFAKLWVMALGKRIKRSIIKAFRVLYTIYVALIFAITLLPVWLLAMVSSRTAAAKIIRLWSKFIFICMFCSVKIVGRENLCKENVMIYAANHASYIDPFALFTVLPPNTIFILKKELMSMPLISLVLKKLNYITVDRWEFAQNIEDTKRIQQKLDQGRSILIFPEGTFTYAKGLRPFKAGAFQLAVDARKSICPIAIKNTRKLLRDGNILLSPVSQITLTICEPIKPEGTDWREVTRLRNAVRKQIAKYCGELPMDLIVAGPEG